ncbi:MAG: TonB-dependent receptor [Opitutaceae bacterium]|tara:strand:+ start:8725 stop:10776 length:2052 start_codon:yes stop_codon:yes gene_type:complete
MSRRLFTTTLLCLTSVALSAQTLDPLIVSVHRDAQPLSQQPFAVDVLSADALRANPALALDDQLKASAAFSLFRRGGSLSANPTAQGVSLRNIGPNGAGRTLVLADGIPLNDPFGGWVTWAKTSRLNLAAVELVRGGGSGAWGSSALGGTIQILSQPTPESTQSAAQFELGEYGTAAAEISTTQVSGANSFTLSARGLHSDGFRRKAPGSAGPIDSATDLEQGYLELEWTHRRESGTTGQLTVRGFSEDRGNGTPLQANRTREFRVAARAEGTRELFSDTAHWSANAYWQTQEYRSLFTAVDATRTTESPVLDQYSVPADAAGASASASWSRENSSTTLGADARWVKGETSENYFRVGNDFVRNRIAGGTQRTAGLFVGHNRALAPDWQLDLGARLDAWELTDGHRTETNRTNGANVRRDRFADRSDAEFNPRAGLVWQANDEWRWQVAAYQAYRLPTLNELYRPFRVGSVITEANPDLKTEHLDGIELGTTWTTERASLRLTGFVTEVEDAVANVTLGFGPGFVPGAGFVPAGGIGRQRRNLDRITVNGFEFAATQRVSDTLTLRADYLYSDAEDDATSRTLPQVSQHTLVSGADWTPHAKWRVSIQGRYVSDAFEDDGNTLTLNSALTWDLRISHQFSDNGNIFLAVENITDKNVIVGRTTSNLLDLGTPRFARIGIRRFW